MLGLCFFELVIVGVITKSVEHVEFLLVTTGSSGSTKNRERNWDSFCRCYDCDGVARRM